MNSKSQSSQIAIVTGASSGIGRAIALRLGRDGFYILAHYNKNQEGAEQTLQQLREQGSFGETIGFDVTDATQVEIQLDRFAARIPADSAISVLVNNAGLHKDGMAGLMSDESFDQVMKANAYGPFYLMRWTLKKMLRQKNGSIVNISSLAGQTGNAGQINYAASKAALISMTKTLSMEVGKRGIRVNAVAPGLISTEMIETIPHLEEMKNRIPLGRFGEPEEVAGVVSFLCSKDAGYMTGSTLSVNGGLFPA